MHWKDLLRNNVIGRKDGWSLVFLRLLSFIERLSILTISHSDSIEMILKLQPEII